MIILKRKIFSVSIIFILISFVLILLVITSLVEDIKRNSQDYVLQRKALVLLQRQFQEFEDFEMPLVILSGFSELDEVVQFHVINSRQTKVKTDLAHRHYLKLSKDKRKV